MKRRRHTPEQIVRKLREADDSPVLEAGIGLTPTFQGAPSLPLEVQATSDSMYWSGTGTGFPEVVARAVISGPRPARGQM